MTSSQNEHPTGTALVLGGGGSAGNAWLIGVLAGLAEGGVDVTDADLVVGTSAGATAAAQLAGTDPRTLLAAILDAPPVRTDGRRGPRPTASTRPVSTHLERTDALIAAASDPADMRRRIGADALELAAANPALRDRWRSTVAARFPGHDWPERRLLLTAVDARSGEPIVFDRASGVDLVDAVAASTSGVAGYRIEERDFVDGGYRTNADNADLAAGYDRVLILSPFGGRTRLPLAWGLDLATQTERLRADGSRVETIFPDAAARAAFGDDMMNPATRPPAARAGQAQGRVAADLVRELWG
ncbi:patatin-like phospholipase family protein [Leifsonia sp. ZF2019]|uniref:patatin-like phospholipase family protein n=1 Tax=Leifsonia sp. ZF2019 TaxID=2781978 RepID=UPI001CBD0498|nr:patatin-like phospholipase family protein [Leifsonia sp. ZF2019]UAJ77805.1 patatin-like phospholipase family protein [Leifsonia sp. ZF2019]